ncbi:hypothetical protein BO70DRAFT_341112 [Aspergillus heteromorphus CBS 117.55]|uniref:EthD domain-containing protein n=1 Tax=Aspergillus heteromorphus CBS 117.55 TaxID=1448321 RepID=A0A317VQW0_9EURO|nr:uncharacterized protein BO70DRAFT_341112 [Aspergillus heteromorphus CBS 117.55]PWY74300.1 hypothetical protein BO70DRAFT_341112 [Aspergillus heteromorphus CBS 117.55]
MPFKLLLFVSRLPHISPEAFKSQYEEHITLVKRLAGDTFPLLHKRTYLARTTVDIPPEGATSRNANTPATVLMGQQSDYDYDVIAEITFADQEGFAAFRQKVSAPDAPEAAAELHAHEAKFMDAEKFGIVVVGDVLETKR